MTENSDHDWDDLNLFRHTDAILFFGTPFRGTHKWYQKDLPILASKKKRYIDKDVFETFRRGNENLRQLRTDFGIKQRRYKKPNVCFFYEQQRSNVGKFVGDENISKVGLFDR